MNKAKLLFPLLLASSLLAACRGTTDEPNGPSSADSTLSSSSEAQYVDPDVEEDTGSLSTGGGMLLDVLLERFLPTDYAFEDTLALHSGLISNVVSSDSSVFSVTKVEGTSNTYSFVTGIAGNAVLSVYNSDGDLAARKIIRVRPFLTSEALAEELVELDTFYGLRLMGTYTLTFISSSPLQAVFTATDDIDTGLRRTVNFVNPTYRESDSMYHYDLELVEDESAAQSQTVLTEALISSTGDEAMIYYSSSSASTASNLLAWLVAGDYLDIHEGFGPDPNKENA